MDEVVDKLVNRLSVVLAAVVDKLEDGQRRWLSSLKGGGSTGMASESELQKGFTGNDLGSPQSEWDSRRQVGERSSEQEKN